MRPLLTIIMSSLLSRHSKETPTVLLSLQEQLTDEVEFLCFLDNMSVPIGRKRDFLVAEAQGRFISAIDDDDEIADDYVDTILEAIRSHPGADAITFNIAYYENGVPQATLRPRILKGHHTALLCPIRKRLYQQASFPFISQGVDKYLLNELKPLIKQEHHIDKVLYRAYVQTDNPDRAARIKKWGRWKP